MKKLLSTDTVLALLVTSTSPASSAQSLLDNIEEAVSKGSTSLSFRARLETAEEDNPLRDAAAATLRTRLTLSSGEVSGLSGVLELDDVSTIGADHYDSLLIDRYRGGYSIVADPVGTEVNQAYLNYALDDSQSVRVGMQRINHGAQRFVGSVAWRQNEQTLDALSYSRSGANLSVDYSYVWNVNRIFAGSKASVQAENLDSDSHIGHANYKTGAGTFGGFFNILDFENAAALSSATYGLSYAHSMAGFSVNASVARQSDHGANPVSYDASYIAADVSYDFGVARLLFGHESLGSDDGAAAFQTPLATLHKWQGWADLFLSTPTTGIEDSYVSLSGKFGAAQLSAIYHTFEADAGGADYGSEWDLIASYPIRPNLAIELKYANYDSDGFKVDTEKFWFSLSLAF